MNMKKLSVLVLVLLLVLIVTACDGANSATWRRSVGVRENSSNSSFSISVRSASGGTRNRTFTLTDEELSSINVNSSSESGEIILTISQDGAIDGTEISMDISNFNGEISAVGLNGGRIRFSLRFDNVRDSSTVINWR
jgi:hypothetical protein